MASKEHIKSQPSTEEQLRRYEARSPEEQEARRVARRTRRAASKARHDKKKGNRLKNQAQCFPSLDERTYVCIDLEQFEWNQKTLTEVGITVFDAKFNNVETTHIIVKENRNKRNKKFVCDNKDNFLFGKSIVMTLAQTKQALRKTLRRFPNVVGHAVRGDLKYLNGMGLVTDHVTVYDTAVMHQILKQQDNTTKLSTCCEEYGIAHEAPHNAANDSHVNTYLFAFLREQMLTTSAKAA